jgi:predicted peptidase
VEYRVDPACITVTGLSMTGCGAWHLANENPDRLAAITPSCGGGDPEAAARIAHLPVWTFHGEDDPSLPVERTQEMIAALKAAGGSPKVSVLPRGRPRLLAGSLPRHRTLRPAPRSQPGASSRPQILGEI